MANLKGITLTLLIGPVAVAPAPAAVIDALESATVTTAVGQRSGWQISFVYSKTSPIATTLLAAGYFDPLIRVILIATINGLPTVLCDGPIGRQDVTASAKPGQSKLVLSGHDVTAYMDLVPLDGMPYPMMPSFARVALMLAKYAMFGVIPVPIPAPFEAVTDPTDKTPAQKGTDFQYIDKLAKDAGYEFYVDPGPAPGTNTAYFGPQVRIGVPQPALSVDMDHASNVEQLAFSADGAGAEMTIGFVKVGPISIPVPVPDVGILNPPLSARPLIPTKFKTIPTERLKLPDVLGALLAGRTRADPITGSGALDVARYGQPLAARRLVGVRGAGLAYDGLWYVRAVTDTVSRGSWKQNFQLARDGLVSNLPALPV
ncbi:hypothetical protein [Sphingomonas nostoxanthinifaciens]|uniref:hypothetical protein n=1 Tax=Sphingomonas nostoxanthinifaciens TaxID=2872652 RepID=UPI001CC21EBB|nr:hypothetical protein [Sphingomonas nostoxanthinifaciens]UAK23291.1 hypothetical protein K8P63_12865 [Sphingomonas nostoxanthinifaciens]